MTPEQTAAAARPAILDLGSAFSEHPRTLRRARQLGLTGWAFYVAGRGGALGDVPAEVVTAALGFLAADAVRDGWELARRAVPPYEIAAHNLTECRRYGAERFADLPGVDRLVALAGRVVTGADATALPLFAAWRAMPPPDDGQPATHGSQTLGARAAALLLLLREHRAGCHLLAVRAVGLTPLEAIISGPEGEAGATAYGWQPPYPAYEPLLRRRAWADALTDRLVGAAYRVLTADERTELITLLAAAHETAAA